MLESVEYNGERGTSDLFLIDKHGNAIVQFTKLK